jgi:hypothetical protein
VVPNGNDVLTKPAWVDAALAEYEAHRAEVVAEAEARQHTLAFGATAVGIVAAGGFNVWDEKLVATVAFLAAVPLISAREARSRACGRTNRGDRRQDGTTSAPSRCSPFSPRAPSSSARIEAGPGTSFSFW